MRGVASGNTLYHTGGTFTPHYPHLRVVGLQIVCFPGALFVGEGLTCQPSPAPSPTLTGRYCTVASKPNEATHSRICAQVEAIMVRYGAHWRCGLFSRDTVGWLCILAALATSVCLCIYKKRSLEHLCGLCFSSKHILTAALASFLLHPHGAHDKG